MGGTANQADRSEQAELTGVVGDPISQDSGKAESIKASETSSS